MLQYPAPSSARRVRAHHRTGLVLAGTAALAAFSWAAVGCGSSSTGVTASVSSATTSAPSSASLSLVTQVPQGTPGSAARPTDWLMAALQSVSSPAQAAGLMTLPNATVQVYNGAGAQVTTFSTDSTGSATFTLAPGTYLFVVNKGGVQCMLAATVTSSTTNLVVSAASTAVAAMLLSQTGSLAIGGADIATYEALATANSPTYQVLLNAVNSNITAGTTFFNPSTAQISDVTIQANASNLGSSVFVVTYRYPAVDQTNVRRQGPIAVAFNKAVNPAELPPTFTGWTVTHNLVSTGQTITINNSNFAQYGAWSYSDSPTTVNGVSLPAHALVFQLSTQAMAANAKEVFTWTFSSLPHATDSTVLTLSGPDQANIINNLTFYTGSTL